MRRLGALLGSASFAVAWLFLVTTAVPRAAFLMHRHAGGDHVHVHEDDAVADHHHDGDDDDDHSAGEAHDHEYEYDHVDRDGLPGFEAPDAKPGLHIHSQQPFHLATRSAVATVVQSTLVAALPIAVHGAPARQTALTAQPRAPPPAVVS